MPITKTLILPTLIRMLCTRTITNKTPRRLATYTLVWHNQIQKIIGLICLKNHPKDIGRHIRLKGWHEPSTSTSPFSQDILKAGTWTRSCLTWRPAQARASYLAWNWHRRQPPWPSYWPYQGTKQNTILWMFSVSGLQISWFLTTFSPKPLWQLP